MSGAVQSALEGEGPTLGVVCFRCGGWTVAIEARHVRGASSDGVGRTTAAIEALLGEAAAPTGPRQYLSVQAPKGGAVVALSVAAPVELALLQAVNIHPLPPLMAVRCQLRGLRALAWPGALDQPPWLVLDAQALLEGVSAEGLNPLLEALAPGISAR